jgi:hypothetical protein
MTIDQIVHYLGPDLVDELADLPISELEHRKVEVEKEINRLPKGSTNQFIANVELKFINHLLS